MSIYGAGSSDVQLDTFLCTFMLDTGRTRSFFFQKQPACITMRAGFVMFSTHKTLLNMFCSVVHWWGWVHRVCWTRWTLVELSHVEFQPLTRTVGSLGTLVFRAGFSNLTIQFKYYYYYYVILKNHLSQTEQIRLGFGHSETQQWIPYTHTHTKKE